MRLLLTCVIILVSAAQAANAAPRHRVPIQFTFGWGTQVEALAPVTADSAAASDFPNSDVRIAYKWDQFWLGFPFWTTNREYIIEATQDGGEAQYFKIPEQDRDALALFAGVTSDTLTPPLFSRIPFGYCVVAFTYLVVKLISGPSPHKRFKGLIKQPRYQQALRIFCENQAEFLSAASAAESPQITEEQIQQCFALASDSLVQNGVSRGAANRNLHFILGYIQKNPQRCESLEITEHNGQSMPR